MADHDDEQLHPYELLDSGMSTPTHRYLFGDKIMLTKERADELEPYGSIRPWGTDDHDLVDDERDIPGLLASAKGREDLARRRIEKRGTKQEKAEESPAVKDFAPLVANTPGPDPVHAAAPQDAPHQRGQQGREKTGGRRG